MRAHKPAISKQGLVLLCILSLVLVFLLVVVVTSKWSKISQEQALSEVSQEQMGIILKQNSATELPLKYDLDQRQYALAIQEAWHDLKDQHPGRILGFKDDPELMAIFYYPSQEEKVAILAYANQPITIETNLVDSLPNGAAYDIALEKGNYQLVVKLNFTSQLTELDLPQILSDVFSTIVVGEPMKPGPVINTKLDNFKSLK